MQSQGLRRARNECGVVLVQVNGRALICRASGARKPEAVLARTALSQSCVYTLSLISSTNPDLCKPNIVMEAEERPIKRLKLSYDDESVAPDGSQTTTRNSGDSVMDNQINGFDDPNLPRDHYENEFERSPELTEGNEDGFPAPEETAPLAETIDPDGQPMSKNQQKKLRKKLEWEAKRDERKVKRKEKTIAKRERKQEKRNQLLENGDLTELPHSKKQKPVQIPVTILIDCDFDDLMRDNERISLAGQITRSYSDNRNSLFRAHLALCSFTGKLRERFDNILSHYTGWKGVRFLECDFVEAAAKAREWMLQPDRGGQLAGSFSALDAEDKDMQQILKEQGEVVYLTSESDDILTELKPYSTYIIGGLVDKNREKGICYKRAGNRGIRTARLPIGEFMDMQSRKVLATNHVNEIILKWLECGDWGEAFMKVIPKRKGGMLKGVDAEENGESEKGPSEGNDVP